MAYAMWMSGSLDAIAEDAYLRIIVSDVKKNMEYDRAEHNFRVSHRAVRLIRDHLLSMRLSLPRQMEVRRTWQWGVIQVRVEERKVSSTALLQSFTDIRYQCHALLSLAEP